MIDAEMMPLDFARRAAGAFFLWPKAHVNERINRILTRALRRESVANLKVATFNINGIRSRLPVLLTWLREVSPDIVCLQELKATYSAFPVAAINDAVYGAIWQGQSAWNGVAILARGTDPIESRRGLPGDHADRQSRYIEAAPGRGVRTTH